MSALDRIPSIGITKQEWLAWSEKNNRPFTDPWVERNHAGPPRGQSEYEIRAKIPRGTNGGRKKKETVNA